MRRAETQTRPAEFMVERIPMSRPFVNEKMKQVAIEVIESKRWVKGPNSLAFGNEFAHHCGALYAVPCASGSASLIAAMRLLDIGPGDEVIVPSLTFFASVSCIKIVGATPIFVDVEEDYWCLDSNEVTKAISPNTKAIIGVHLFGQPYSIDSFEGIPVIEDAAQAHGASLDGKIAGSLADIGCFSFFPSKNMAVGGEGGMLTTTRPELVERLQSWVDHGRIVGEGINELSTNLRISEIQAGIGRIQLRHLDEWQIRRNQIANSHTIVVDENTHLTSPKVRTGAIHGWHQYTIQCEDAEQLFIHLNNRGIDSRIHYQTPCHMQKVMKKHKQYGIGNLPITEKLCGQLISIPVHPFLRDEELSRIHQALADFCPT